MVRLALRAKALGIVLVCGAGFSAAALGQSEVTLRALQRLHDQLARPGEVLASRDVQAAADLLAEWELSSEKLSPQDRARLWRVELYIALAQGDARRAHERARQLRGEFADEPATLEAVYLAACAAGDAQLGSEALKGLSRNAAGAQRRLLSARRRWIRGVGQRAPDVVIRTEDMTEFSARRRGERVLVVDFWNVLIQPAEKDIEALRALYDEYRQSLHVDFVGVNADAEARVEQARLFVRKNGYRWKQRYEHASRGAPITDKAFHAGKPPWQVLIDTFGYIRAIGAAREPGFQYALRAAVMEARGDLEPVMPRTRTGEQPTRPSAKVEPERPDRGGAAAEGELPSNAEARAKLNLARTYLKTGKRTDAKRLFEEIVRDYPGTREAKEAREYLDSIWNP